MLLAEATTVLFLIGIGLSIASQLIFKQKASGVLQDDNPNTTVKKGGYISLVIGRARVAPVIAFISDPKLTTAFSETNGSSFLFGQDAHAGGKRQSQAGTGGGENWGYTLWHIVCVGPVARLHGMWVNGAVDWASAEGYDPVNFPSGKTGPGSGDRFFPLRGSTPFSVGFWYWGERDQPIEPLATEKLGIASRWPLVCHVWWGKRTGAREGLFVGNIKQIPLFEFEVSCLPRSRLVTSKNYFYRTGRDESTFVSDTIAVLTGGPIGVRNVVLAQGGPHVPGTYHGGDIAYMHGPHAQTLFGKPSAYFVIWRVIELFTGGGGQRIFPGPEAEQLGIRIDNKQTRSSGGSRVTPITQGPNDGANMAHALDQLMFARFPYGAAVNRDDFDIDSLEEVGRLVDVGSERLSASIVIANGDPAQAAIAGLLQDMGVMISWNPRIGKYQFLAIRDNQTAVVIPRVLLNDPLPEIKTNHEEKPVQRIVFNFRENTRNYKNGTFSFDDDGQATQREVYRARPVNIPSTAHRGTAQRIGVRRVLEELPRHAALLLKTGGAARLLQAGRPLVVDDRDFIPFPMRIDAVRYSVKNGKVELTCLQDLFAAGQQTSDSQAPNSGGFAQSLDSNTVDGPDTEDFIDRGEVDQLSLALLPGGTLGIEDAQVDILELPRLYQPGRQNMEITIGRIRSGLDVGTARVLMSVDGLTYIPVASAIPPTTGGTLKTALGITEFELDSTTVRIVPTGPDIAELGSFVSDDASHKLGRLIMVIGTEFFYVKGVTPVNDSTGDYFVDLPIRARMGVDQQAHSAGAKVTFMVDRSIRPIKDVLLQPLRTVKIKLLPQASSGVSTGLDEATEHEITLKGTAFIPLDPANLRVPPGGSFKEIAMDVTFVWDYRNGDSIRSGAGFQGAGDPTSEDAVEGEFVFQTWTDDPDMGGILKRTVDGLKVATIVYTHAQYTTDFGIEATFWISVKNVKAGFESARITKMITTPAPVV